MQREVIKLSEGAELHYYPHFLDDPDRLFPDAEKMSFSDEIVTMYAKPNVIRRRTVDYGLTYSYNVTAKPSIDWESLPLALKHKLEQHCGVEFPQCACNEFVDQEAYIGP